MFKGLWGEGTLSSDINHAIEFATVFWGGGVTSLGGALSTLKVTTIQIIANKQLN